MKEFNFERSLYLYLLSIEKTLKFLEKIYSFIEKMKVVFLEINLLHCVNI